jgi:hypothetical protein
MSFMRKKLETKEVALTICFTALYAVLGFIPLSQVLGLPGKAITVAAIMAPIIGVLIGPYLGLLATILGGGIGFFVGFFSPMGFVSGAVAALCSGLVSANKRTFGAIVYLIFLISFGFFPSIGPAWLFPVSMWLQMIGFLVLVSPLETAAIRSLNSNEAPKFLLAFYTISLTSTLAGQIAGSLVFEIIVAGDTGWWTALWQGLTLLYPAERIIIALAAALVGAPLLKILTISNLKQFLTHETRKEKSS